MFRSRVPAGVNTGGQFASRGRQESPVSLADRRRHDNVVLQNMTGGNMDPATRRRLARQAAQQAVSDGTAAKMLGRDNAGDIGRIEAAARNDWKLDQALDALVEQERKSPGRIPPNALGYHLCKQLMLAERAPRRMAS